MERLLLKIMICYLLLIGVRGKIFTLEAEADRIDFRSFRARTNASGNGSMILYGGEKLKFSFCLPQSTSVILQEIVYSNDGESDLVSVDLDTTRLGKFQTRAMYQNGYGWNQFLKSGPIGDSYYLPAGRHSILLSVCEADAHGMEIDRIEIEVLTNSLDPLFFTCQYFCLNGSPVVSRRDDNVSNGRIEQRSTLTGCAEEDNVRVNVYHDSVTRYKIVSSSPRYFTALNNRTPDFTSCHFSNSLIWEIGKDDGNFSELNVTGSWKFRHVFDVAFSPTSSFPAMVEGPGSGSSLDIVFSVAGPSKGLVASQKGSILTLKLMDINVPSLVLGLSYFSGNSSPVMQEIRNFSKGTLKNTWNIPDFTWSEHEMNTIRLQLINGTRNISAKVDYIRLNQRPERGEITSKAYSDQHVIIETVDIDFWWLSPLTMTLKVKDGRFMSNVDYFRVYVKVPHTDGYAQIFVLYQDGNARILTLPPTGTDWIPFGSSVIIGQTDPNVTRPYAAIRHVDVDPQSLTITLYYLNGGKATVHLQGGVKETEVTIDNLVFKRDLLSHPFASFRSMWVSDNNGDVDHVTVGGYTSHHIMGDWHMLYGTSFYFYRNCVSRHNTLSPDISLAIMPETPDL